MDKACGAERPVARRASCDPVNEVECALIARGPDDLCEVHLAEFRAYQVAHGYVTAPEVPQ